MTNEEIALRLAVAIMTGKRASDGNAKRAAAIYRQILKELQTPEPIPARRPGDYDY